jgi:hypothetical protein
MFVRRFWYNMARLRKPHHQNATPRHCQSVTRGSASTLTLALDFSALVKFWLRTASCAIIICYSSGHAQLRRETGPTTNNCSRSGGPSGRNHELRNRGAWGRQSTDLPGPLPDPQLSDNLTRLYAAASGRAAADIMGDDAWILQLTSGKP